MPVFGIQVYYVVETRNMIEQMQRTFLKYAALALHHFKRSLQYVTCLLLLLLLYLNIFVVLNVGI